MIWSAFEIIKNVQLLSDEERNSTVVIMFYELLIVSSEWPLCG
jgi:hypothetical protein